METGHAISYHKEPAAKNIYVQMQIKYISIQIYLLYL